MALVQSTQVGATYSFGFKASDAPVITGFYAREAQLKFGPEVYETAMQGEGMVDSVTVTLPALRKVDGSFTGQIDDTFDPGAFAVSFTFACGGTIGTRRFIIKPGGISKPVLKGKYTEVTIEAESFGLIS